MHDGISFLKENVVMPGLGPGIHEFFVLVGKTWMAGTSPAMTTSFEEIVI